MSCEHNLLCMNEWCLSNVVGSMKCVLDRFSCIIIHIQYNIRVLYIFLAKFEDVDLCISKY